MGTWLQDSVTDIIHLWAAPSPQIGEVAYCGFTMTADCTSRPPPSGHGKRCKACEYHFMKSLVPGGSQ